MLLLPPLWPPSPPAQQIKQHNSSLRAPPGLVIAHRVSVTGTPDTRLILTTPFIFIRMVPARPSWAQAHSRHGGRPLGSSQGWGGGHTGSARGWGRDECARAQSEQQRGSAAPPCSVPVRALVPGSLMDACPCGQSSLKAGRRRGQRVV